MRNVLSKVIVVACGMVGCAAPLIAKTHDSQYRLRVPPAAQNEYAVKVEITYAVSGPVMLWEHTLGELFVEERIHAPGVSVSRCIHLSSLPRSKRKVVVVIPLKYLQNDTLVLIARSQHRPDLRITGHRIIEE